MRPIVPRRAAGWRAFTLVEMLVAMTASLILFGAVMTIFQLLSETVGRSRRMGRLDEDLCGVTTQLQQDLAGVTANKDGNGLSSPVPAGIVDGYFEVIEGPSSDLWDNSAAVAVNKALNPLPNRIVGDVDDMLFFTTRSVGNDPFTGKFGNTNTTSFEAEVAYFCKPTPNTSNPQLYTLYRRQNLIIGAAAVAPFDSKGSMPFPGLGGPPPAQPGQIQAGWLDFYDRYDLSVRRERINQIDYLYLNTANDLQRRRNRFAHDPVSNGFIPPADHGISGIDPSVNNCLSLSRARINEDSLLTNVIGFDVRLLEPDPSACERIAPDTTRLQPGDRDYWAAGAVNVTSAATNIFVDLGYNRYATNNNNPQSVSWYFSGYGAVSGLRGSASTSCTYDTWSTYYTENGVDDDGFGGNENESSPYPYSLPGIQVTVRLYDASTKTIRQKTVTKLFK